MWLTAEYASTSLYSLKPSWATSSGGKSLLLPTPFAVKMALVDAACRLLGAGQGEAAWDWIRGLDVALHGPERIVVTNTFARILKPRRGEADEGSADAGPLQRSIGFREYVFLAGALGIGLRTAPERLSLLSEFMLQINYLGRRGGLMQLLAPPAAVEDLPPGYQVLAASAAEPFALEGIVQPLDDVGASTPFDRVNIYSGVSMRQDKDRILHHVVIPYRLVQSSRGYSLYERLPAP